MSNLCFRDLRAKALHPKTRMWAREGFRPYHIENGVWSAGMVCDSSELMMSTTCFRASSQNLNPSPEWLRMVLSALRMVRFRRLATPFCSGVRVAA